MKKMELIKEAVKAIAKSEAAEKRTYNFDWLENAINDCKNQVSIDDVLPTSQEKYEES